MYADLAGGVLLQNSGYETIEPDQMNVQQLRYELFKAIRREDEEGRFKVLIKWAKGNFSTNFNLYFKRINLIGLELQLVGL